MINKKAIAGILVATIALASVAVAVSAEGEGGVGPMSILPGAITTDHLANGAVTNSKLGSSAVTTDKIAAYTIAEADIGPDAINSTMIINYAIQEADIGPDAINSTMIIDGQVQESDIAVNQVNATILRADAIPVKMVNTTTPVSTTNGSYSTDLQWDSWNVTTDNLPRAAYLAIHWTGFDCWTTDSVSGNYSYLRFAVDSELLTAPFTDVIFADSTASNQTKTVTAYYYKPVGTGEHVITVQIRCNGADAPGVGINAQSMVVEALPA